MDFVVPSWATIVTEDYTSKIKCENNMIQVDDVAIFFKNQSKHLDIFVENKTSKLKYLKLRWSMEIDKKSKIMGDDWERSYGTLGFRPIQPNRILPWYFLISTKEKTTGIGVKTQPNSMCFWQVDTKGITLNLDLRNGGTGVQLNGRRLLAAQVLFRDYIDLDSFKAAVSFCKAMCQNPLLPEIPIYGSNNWYYAYGETSEQDIIKDAKYLLKMTKDCKNSPFMVLDDGWQEKHRILDYNGGPWLKGNSKFKNLKKLNSEIKCMGLRTGIWFRPLLNETKEFDDSCRINGGTLDPTHPRVQHYLREDIRRICSWGFELIKHDFSTFDLFKRWGFEMNPLVTEKNWNFYDRSLTNAEIVKNFYKLIFEECLPTKTMILGCNTIGHLGAGLMHIHRIGDDTSGKDWERTRQIGVNTLAFRLPQHNTFFHIDADCVGITGEIEWRYNKQWTEVIAKSGTPLFVSVKPNILNPSELLEMQQLMTVASKQQQHMVPLDWELIDCPELWGDGEETISYEWYEEAGLEFNTTPVRYQSFLSIE